MRPMNKEIENARIAFTGKMVSMTRRDACRLVRDLGGEPTDSVSARTSVLVVGMLGWPLLRDGSVSKKLLRAEELNEAGCSIRIIAEMIFLELAGLKDQKPETKKTFSAADAGRIMKIKPGAIRRWEQFGLVRSHEGYYDFQDLVSLLSLNSLISQGARPERIAESLHRLAMVLPGTDRPLAQLRILLEHPGGLMVELGNTRLSATGQLIFDFEGKARIPGKVVPIDSESLSVTEWFELGLEFELEELYTEASECFRTVLTLDSNYSPAYLHLGNVLREMGILWAAEEFYRFAGIKDPGSALAWYCLAGVQEERGKLDEAIESLGRSLGIQPEFADAHFNLALCYEKRGEKADAVRHWFAYLKLEPQSEGARIARQHLSCR